MCETYKMFNRELARVMKMTKKAIVAEMLERGFVATQAGADYKCRTWKKDMLARDLADRITRMEARGY